MAARGQGRAYAEVGIGFTSWQLLLTPYRASMIPFLVAPTWTVELQEFAYVTSHDLEEPLRQVSAFAQLLEREIGRSANEQVTVAAIQGRPVLLERLSLNLLFNAMKYREPTRSPEISVAAARVGGWRVGVRDNGIGIPRSISTASFECFSVYTTTPRPGVGSVWRFAGR